MHNETWCESELKGTIYDIGMQPVENPKIISVQPTGVDASTSIFGDEPFSDEP